MPTKLLVPILLLIILSVQGEGQPVIDCLRHKIEIAKNDTSKIMLYHDIIEEYEETNSDSTIYFGQQLLFLSRKLKFKLEEVHAHNSIGYAFLNTGNYSRSLQALLTALSLAEDPKSENNVVPEKYLDPQKFLKHPVTGHLLRLGMLARQHQTLGVLYGNNYNREKEYDHYLQALSLAEQSGDGIALCETNYTLGRLYIYLKKPDSALICEQRAYALSVQTGHKKYIGGVLLNLGRTYSEIGKTELAIAYFRKAIDENIKQNYLRGVVAGNLLLANLYNQSRKTDSSLHFANTALDIARYLNFPDLLLRSYTSLAAFYRSRNNNDSAVKYQELIIKMNDSLSDSRRMQQFQNIDFDERQRKQEIEAARKAYQNRLQIYWLATGLAAFLLVAVFLWRNNRHRQKSNRILQRQKKELELALNELKSAQNQLIQSEKMASLGELTAGIAHEIQNPLNFVNNFSEVNKELIEELKSQKSKVKSERDDQLEDELLTDIQENEEKINHHGKRADAIVKGMLQHSRVSTGQKESTDINALADECLRLSYAGLRAKHKDFNAVPIDIGIETHFDRSIGKIEVIPQDIGRVLLNIVNNAFYAVNEKKKQLDGAFEPVVTVSTERSGDKIQILVRDNGNGIPHKAVDKIFQPFFTTKPTGQGTGLGLSLSYDIIKAHGGEIKVDTKEGEGSGFIIQLPGNTNPKLSS